MELELNKIQIQSLAQPGYPNLQYLDLNLQARTWHPILGFLMLIAYVPWIERCKLFLGWECNSLLDHLIGLILD